LLKASDTGLSLNDILCLDPLTITTPNLSFRISSGFRFVTDVLTFENLSQFYRFSSGTIDRLALSLE